MPLNKETKPIDYYTTILSFFFFFLSVSWTDLMKKNPGIKYGIMVLCTDLFGNKV